jgi:hypothetical protein
VVSPTIFSFDTAILVAQFERLDSWMRLRPRRADETPRWSAVGELGGYITKRGCFRVPTVVV